MSLKGEKKHVRKSATSATFAVVGVYPSLSADTDADLTKSLSCPVALCLPAACLPCSLLLLLWFSVRLCFSLVYKQELFAKVDCICILSMQSSMQMLIDVHIMDICAYSVSLMIKCKYRLFLSHFIKMCISNPNNSIVFHVHFV